MATGNLYGGVEVFLQTLARHGHTAGMAAEYTVCWNTGRLAQELRAAGASIHNLGEVRLSRPWQAWQARRRLTALLKSQHYDIAVLHSGWTHLLFGSVLRRAGLPVVMGVHTVIPHGSRLEKWARRTPLNGVFANSAFTAASARNWYPGHPEVTVIHLPVEAPESLSEAARAHLRESLGAQPGDCVILQASRMQSLKGQRTLLTALAELKQEPGWVCWLVGGAQRPEEVAFVEELQTLAQQNGLLERVRFLGQRQDISGLLGAADLVCQVNQDPEAFGLIYVEAMAAGLPVIAANQGGITEVVDATCGALIPPGDAASLAAVLQGWIRQPTLRRTLGAAGRQRARQCCDTHQQVRQVAEFLRGVLARSR